MASAREQLDLYADRLPPDVRQGFRELLDRLEAEARVAVLAEAADAVSAFTGNEIDANAQMLRRRAAGTPRPGDPS